MNKRKPFNMDPKYQILPMTQTEFEQRVHENFVSLSQLDDEDANATRQYHYKVYEQLMEHNISIDFIEFVKLDTLWYTYVFDMRGNEMDENLKNEINEHGYYQIFNNVFGLQYTRDQYESLQNAIIEYCE